MNYLPVDIIEYISSKLEVQDLIRMSSCCKYLNETINKDHIKNISKKLTALKIINPMEKVLKKIKKKK